MNKQQFRDGKFNYAVSNFVTELKRHLLIDFATIIRGTSLRFWTSSKNDVRFPRSGSNSFCALDTSSDVHQLIHVSFWLYKHLALITWIQLNLCISF